VTATPPRPAWVEALAPPTPIDAAAAMELSLALAAASSQQGDGPFGAVIVDPDGQVVGVGWNRVVASHDSTAHAEIVALRDAQARAQDHTLPGHHLFSSCAPCIQCFGAIWWSGLAAVSWCAAQEDAAAAGFDEGPVTPTMWHELRARKGTHIHAAVGPVARAAAQLRDYAGPHY